VEWFHVEPGCVNGITEYQLSTNYCPLFLANTGTSKIVFTSNCGGSAGRIGLFDTLTGTLVDNKSWSSSSPWDITMDPTNGDNDWFTFSNTNKIGKLTISTWSSATYSVPGTPVASPRGITVDSTNVYFTDIGQDKLWKRNKSTGAYTSRTIIEGDSYGTYTVDQVNNQVWFVTYNTDKLIHIPATFDSTTSYYVLPKHPPEAYDTVDCDDCNGQEPFGMYRVVNAGIDTCINYYITGHTGCIHTSNILTWHNADYVGGNPIGIVFDPDVTGGLGREGTHITTRLPTVDKINLMSHITV
jgi:streptogramin lyase